ASTQRGGSSYVKVAGIDSITGSVQENHPYHIPAISDTAAGCIGNSWVATSTTNASSAREGHTAVWTGTEMIIWGGDDGVNTLNTGGRYSPSTDTWTATSTTNAPVGREAYTAVWTGSEMIVWGGNDAAFNIFHSGGKYNPITDTWVATNLTNAPTARYIHTAVWTGSEMIVWGGTGANYFNTGGRYNPNTDSWTATSTVNAPTGRYGPTAVWTGSEMIIWGGAASAGPSRFNTGGRYNPATNSWTATSTTNAPSARAGHTAVWTGTEMIIWGGDDGVNILNTGGRYCAQSGATPTPTPTATPTASPTCSPGGAGPWGMGNPYPTPNDRYGFAQTSTHFYVFAGGGGGPPTN